MKNGGPGFGVAPGARVLSRSSRMIVPTAPTNSAGARIMASVKIFKISGELSITVFRGSPTITGAHFCQIGPAILP
jgi:hypothetical protein